MKIDKVHFYDYVMLPGSKNGRAQTIFAKDVDTIELLPNGVRITKGDAGAFWFDKAVRSVEYEVARQAAPVVIPSVDETPTTVARPKGKPAVKIEFSETNE